RSPDFIAELGRCLSQWADLVIEYGEFCSELRVSFLDLRDRLFGLLTVALLFSLKRDSDFADLVFKLLLVFHKLLKLDFLWSKCELSFDFVFDLAQDQSSSPTKNSFGHFHVTEHMIADVQNLIAA